jgi:hypothetical protein
MFFKALLFLEISERGGSVTDVARLEGEGVDT